MKRIPLFAVMLLALGAGELAAQSAAAAGTNARADIASGRVSVYLADPELGVVGSYVQGDSTLYFEVRAGVAKAGESVLSARLLDAGGRTIAVAGRTMDASWLADQRFDAHAAVSSQKLALPLASALAHALADPAFDAERAALTALALRTAGSNLNLEPNIAQMSKSLAAPSSASAIEQFYARSTADLQLHRDNRGDVSGTFRGIALQATQLTFAGELDEEAAGPRIETYARLAAASGNTISAEFGGDLVPVGWEWDNENSSSAVSTNTLSDLGAAIMAAQALAKASSNPYISKVQPAIVESFSRLATGLRDNLLPRTDDHASEQAKAGGVWSPSNNLSSNSNIWKKPLNNSPIGEHSANRTSHYVWSSRTSYTLNHDHRFCNHGGCPYASGMSQKCQYSGNFANVWRHSPQRNTTNGSSTDHSWHTCNTGYSLVSWFGHNCHDDSWTQLQWVQGQGAGASPDHNRCNSAAFYAYAPSCSD